MTGSEPRSRIQNSRRTGSGTDLSPSERRSSTRLFCKVVSPLSLAPGSSALYSSGRLGPGRELLRRRSRSDIGTGSEKLPDLMAAGGGNEVHGGGIREPLWADGQHRAALSGQGSIASFH